MTAAAASRPEPYPYSNKVSTQVVRVPAHRNRPSAIRTQKSIVTAAYTKRGAPGLAIT